MASEGWDVRDSRCHGGVQGDDPLGVGCDALVVAVGRTEAHQALGSSREGDDHTPAQPFEDMPRAVDVGLDAPGGLPMLKLAETS